MEKTEFSRLDQSFWDKMKARELFHDKTEKGLLESSEKILKTKEFFDFIKGTNAENFYSKIKQFIEANNITMDVGVYAEALKIYIKLKNKDKFGVKEEGAPSGISELYQCLKTVGIIDIPYRSNIEIIENFEKRLFEMINNDVKKHEQLNGKWTWYHNQVFYIVKNVILEKLKDTSVLPDNLDSILINLQGNTANSMRYFDNNFDKIYNKKTNIGNGMIMVQNIFENMSSDDLLRFMQDRALSRNFFAELGHMDEADSKFNTNHMLAYYNDVGTLKEVFGGSETDPAKSKIIGLKTFFNTNFSYIKDNIDFNNLFDKNSEKLSSKDEKGISVAEKIEKELSYWSAYYQNNNSIKTFAVLLNPEYGLVSPDEGKKMFFKFYTGTFKTSGDILEKAMNQMEYGSFFEKIKGFQNNNILGGIYSLEKALKKGTKKEILEDLKKIKISFAGYGEENQADSISEIFGLMIDTIPSFQADKNDLLKSLNIVLKTNNLKESDVFKYYDLKKIQSFARDKILNTKALEENHLNKDYVEKRVNMLESNENGESKLKQVLDKTYEDMTKPGHIFSDLPEVFYNNLLQEIKEFPKNIKDYFMKILNPQNFNDIETEDFLKYFSFKVEQEKKISNFEKAKEIALKIINNPKYSEKVKNIDEQSLIEIILHRLEKGDKEIDFERIKSNALGRDLFAGINTFITADSQFREMLEAKLKGKNINLKDYIALIQKKLENNGLQNLGMMREYLNSDPHFKILADLGIFGKIGPLESKIEKVKYNVDFIKGINIEEILKEHDNEIQKARKDVNEKYEAAHKAFAMDKPIEQRKQIFHQSAQKLSYDEKIGEVKGGRLNKDNTPKTSTPTATESINNNTETDSGIEFSDKEIYIPQTFNYEGKPFGYMLKMDNGENIAGWNLFDVNTKAIAKIFKSNGLPIDILDGDPMIFEKRFGFNITSQRLDVNQNIDKIVNFMAKYIFEQTMSKLEKIGYTQREVLKKILKEVIPNPKRGLKKFFEFLEHEKGLDSELGIFTGGSLEKKISLDDSRFSSGFKDFEIKNFFDQKRDDLATNTLFEKK